MFSPPETVCSRCQTDVSPHLDRCVNCQKDVGFPNVRAAWRQSERDALSRTYVEAKQRSAAQGNASVVDKLETALEQSEAVICKPWGVINTLLSRDSRLLQTFHQEIEAEGRLPESNDFDRERAGVDATFFPLYHDRIRFAALSIDGKGSTAYGCGCLVLKEMSISERATVFIENTIAFVRRTKHPAGQPPPQGLTAVWPDRAKLGIAKLADHVYAGMSAEDLATLVLRQTGTTDGDDFLEVHVFGPIHRSSVSRVGGKIPRQRADRVMVLQLQRDLQAAGVRIEITL
jgi:hypothetical protein